MGRYDLTPEERRIIAEATPEELAAAAADLVQDGQFWRELGATIVQGFCTGFLRGLDR
jgi:hypothetical protein